LRWCGNLDQRKQQANASRSTLGMQTVMTLLKRFWFGAWMVLPQYESQEHHE
jgi:hypothetical protein